MLHVLLTFWGSGMGHFPEDSLICVIYDAAAKGPLVVWDVPKHDIPRVCVCVCLHWRHSICYLSTQAVKSCTWALCCVLLWLLSVMWSICMFKIRREKMSLMYHYSLLSLPVLTGNKYLAVAGPDTKFISRISWDSAWPEETKSTWKLLARSTVTRTESLPQCSTHSLSLHSQHWRIASQMWWLTCVWTQRRGRNVFLTVTHRQKRCRGEKCCGNFCTSLWQPSPNLQVLQQQSERRSWGRNIVKVFERGIC